jgi:hypothetical protein
MFVNKETHESYGMIQISRVSGGSSALFGSSIKHQHKIRLSIHNAYVKRDLHQDWYNAELRSIVEVEMSLTQFAEAITSMNTTGVPVTLRYVNDKRMEDCPFTDKRQQFENELKRKMQELSRKLDVLNGLAEGLVAMKAPSKGDRENLLKEVNRVRQDIADSLPFVYSQFNEQMDKTVLEAKGEFEALVGQTIHSLGLQALKAEDLRMLGEGDEANGRG